MISWQATRMTRLFVTPTFSAKREVRRSVSATSCSPEGWRENSGGNLNVRSEGDAVVYRRPLCVIARSSRAAKSTFATFGERCQLSRQSENRGSTPAWMRGAIDK